MFERSISISLGDVGYGLKVRKGPLLDRAHLARHEFFAQNGFAHVEAGDTSIVPLITNDAIRYFESARVMEALRLVLSIAAISDDGKQFVLCCDYFHDDGEPALRICSTGIWTDAATGKAVVPPAGIRTLLESLPPAPVIGEPGV